MCHVILLRLQLLKANGGCHRDNILSTLVTNHNNKIIFPSVKHIKKFERNKDYFLQGFAGYLNTLVFATDFVSKPTYMKNGQELRIWYGEDLADFSESDNSGTHCVEVVSNILQYQYFKE